MNDLRGFLSSTIGLEVKVIPSNAVQRLPLALRQYYQHWTADICGQQCLFLIATDGLDRPRNIAKHLAIIRNAWSSHIAVVAATMTAHLRRTLLAERIPFVVPGTQVYLPFLGMLLTERFSVPKVPTEAIRPATQAVLLWWIHHGVTAADTARELSQHLDYTAMSLSRVFNELEHLSRTMLGLTIERIGRERKAIWSGNAQQLWNAAKPHLRDPVLRRHQLPSSDATPGLPAGLSGIAMLSDLVEPNVPVVAIDRLTWLAFNRPPEVRLGEQATVEVEVWSHASDLHREIHGPPPITADPLAMSLTFSETRDRHDERLAAALEKLIEEHVWRW